MDCRMFISSGNRNFNARLYRSLLFASERDVFLENRSHNSGWGIAILSENEEIYWRSSIPIYEYIMPLNIFPERSYAMFHARLASTGEPINGANDSHPYRVQGEETIYIAHNGHVKKEILGKEFNIEFRNKTDTEVLAFILSIMDGDSYTRIRKMIDTVHDLGANETLNLMFLVNSRSSLRGYYYSEFSTREKYLTLFKYLEGDNRAVVSSTIAYYLGLIDLEHRVISGNVEPVERSILQEV
ncbi:MAG: hypothetical protein ACP5G5_04305 [Thermoplasmata archaeon]|jgi:glutamine amidotransferase|nr:hypothetical protein [Thermoplasmatales archaeon]